MKQKPLLFWIICLVLVACVIISCAAAYLLYWKPHHDGSAPGAADTETAQDVGSGQSGQDKEKNQTDNAGEDKSPSDNEDHSQDTALPEIEIPIVESESIDGSEQNTPQGQQAAPNGNGGGSETVTPEMLDDGIAVNEQGDIVLPEVP